MKDSMGTSDGINSGDWERLRELAIALLGMDSDPEERVSREELLAYLDALEAKYGTLPSILATRADYIDDYATKERLYRDAYSLAHTREDLQNELHIAHSLAQFYIEELVDVIEGRIWLERLEAHLRLIDDASYSRDAESLRGVLMHLEPTGE